jgi:ABC-type nitrate/sulfonate/bicarbonate transport system ATPase subunit
MIHIQNLTHSFQDKIILDDVEMIVDTGKIHALIGITGAGKTLLLKIIAKLVHLQVGTIKNNNEKLSYVFQQAPFFPWLTLQKSLELGTGKSAIDILPYLKKFRLEEYVNHYPKEISGGTLQKFNLLRAFLTDAKLILLDEPFSHLDIVQKENLYDFMFELWSDLNPTILFVTHDIDEALVLSHQISFLSKKEKNIKKVFEVRNRQSRVPESLIVLRTNPLFQNIFTEIHALLKDELS